MNIALLLLLVVLAPQQYPPVAEVREAFLKKLDRPKIAPEPAIVSTETKDGFIIEHFSIATEKKQATGAVERMPILLIRPEKAQGRLPAVVVMHGTGGTKEGMRGWCVDLAKRGIIGIAIDARYHGERAEGKKGAARYHEAITAAWRAKPGEQEHPFYYDTVWDLWRLGDYLETRAEVDPKRLGMIGFSMGGIQTWLAASVDERWKVCVPAIAAQSYRWSLENDLWQARAKTIGPPHDAAAKDMGEPAVNQRVCRELWNKIIPGMLDQFDCPSMIRMFAGRPMLIPSGELDQNCPLGGAKLAFAAAEAAYKAAGCPEKLRIMVAEGVGHKVTPEQNAAALEWLVKWLN
jgi:dienelactone hydrolase